MTVKLFDDYKIEADLKNDLDSIPIEAISNGIMNFGQSQLEKSLTNYVNIGVGYRIFNNGITLSGWKDQVFIIGTLTNDLTGQILASCQVTAFDISRKPIPKIFDQMKTSAFGVFLSLPGSYTLTLKSKFAVWGLAGKYVLFAGGAEVYLDGAHFKSVKFEPTQNRPYSENEVVSFKITVT